MNLNFAHAQNGLIAVSHLVRPDRAASQRMWRLALVLALLITLLPLRAVQAQLAPQAEQETEAQQRVYVPMVAVTQRDVAGSGETPAACNLSAEEQEVAKLIAESGDQQRAQMNCNAILSEVARARAKDMAERAYFSHTNPDGIGPNRLVVQAGYELPSWYSDKRDANNVESIAAGFATAEDVFRGWQGSDGHRRHILGLIDFYADQESFGIGYYYKAGSPYGHYWVFISAHPEGIEPTSQPAQLPGGMP